MKQYCNSQILGRNVLHVHYTPLIYQQEVEMSACACFDFFQEDYSPEVTRALPRDLSEPR